jgi:predicted RNase H-like HicB family nuclease
LAPREFASLFGTLFPIEGLSFLMQHLNYTIVIEPDEDAYHAFVPALKGCHSCGDTLEEARTNIREAIELYIETLRDLGEEIPIEPEPILIERLAVEA